MKDAVPAFRRALTQAEFFAAGERAWQAYLRTGLSRPANQVFDRIQSRIDARRRELTEKL
ncbi:hypothetical protein [Rhizobacter sp. Root404]|uniref:hypothetical protein n=1 Tax=Rhizobacter sp. Root404 TaxID=1736528 RepID=UPI0012F8BB55|nr:hypothetical protein [Rhizobacter sp. Root404]